MLSSDEENNYARLRTRKKENGQIERIVKLYYDQEQKKDCWTISLPEQFTDEQVKACYEWYVALMMHYDFWRLPKNKEEHFRQWSDERFNIRNGIIYMHKSLNPSPSKGGNTSASNEYEKLPLNSSSLYTIYQAKVKDVISLMQAMKTAHLTGNESESTLLTDRVFSIIFNLMNATYYSVQGFYQVQWTSVPNSTTIESLPYHMFKFELANQTDPKDLLPLQKIILHVLNESYRLGYRKKDGGVYEQIIAISGGSDDEESTTATTSSYLTHAWKRVYDMDKYIMKICTENKDIDFQTWKNLTHRGGIVKEVESYFQSADTIEFPDLKPDRHVFSFKNGLYNCSENRFYNYSKEGNLISDNLVSSNYFDVSFPEELWKGSIRNDSDDNTQPLPKIPNVIDNDFDWFNSIKTPTFDQIFKFQEISDEVLRFVFMCFGRMFYYLKERDKAQFILFIKGIAGSGKSTLLTYISSFYEQNDIGVMSANMEEKFAWSAIYKKMLWICLEVQEKMSTNQGDFQNVITGESMSIARKNQTAVSHLWNIPGMAGGNVFPRYADKSLSISRRILSLEFLKIVSDSVNNPNLAQNMEEERGAFLLKANLAYHWYTNKYYEKDVWNYAPVYFKETRQRMRAIISPLYAFIRNLEVVTLDYTCYMQTSDFKILFKNWLSENGLSHTKIDQEQFDAAFTEFSIVNKYATMLTENGSPATKQWLIGIGKTSELLRLSEDESQDRLRDLLSTKKTIFVGDKFKEEHKERHKNQSANQSANQPINQQSSQQSSQQQSQQSSQQQSQQQSQQIIELPKKGKASPPGKGKASPPKKGKESSPQNKSSDVQLGKKRKTVIVD